MILVDFKKYIKNPKGVIHIGGHCGEEQRLYDDVGFKKVIWIEAIAKSSEIITKMFIGRDDITVWNNCISDEEHEQTFYVTNNLASSSLLQLGSHKKHHPKIFIEKEVKLETVRLDTLIRQHNIDMQEYNMLNIDVQGAELKVLRSLGDYLDYIDYINVEVNTEHVYKGCPLMGDIDTFLKNFTRVEVNITKYNWGDAFYIKNNI